MPDHVFALMEAVQQRLSEVLDGALAPRTREVGLRRLRLLQLIPDGGASQTELAALSRVTKQALTDHIFALEDAGLITRSPGATDRRVWHVQRTRSGDAACADLDAAIAHVDRHVRELLGSQRAANALQALTDLAT